MRNFTREFVEQMHSLYMAGESCYTIGKKYGVSDPTVKAYFLKFDFPIKTKKQILVDMQKTQAVTLLEKYGVDHISRIKGVQEKITSTCLEKYGLKRCQPLNRSLTPEAKEKMEQTNLIKYGSVSSFGNLEVREKSKQTMLQRYGVENIFGSDQGKEQLKETNLKKYGFENPSFNEEVIEKIRIKNILNASKRMPKTAKTKLERYGVTHGQNLEVREKIRQTCLEKYKASCPLQNKEVREKGKKTNLERYGFEYSSQNKDVFRRTLSNSKRTTEKTHWETEELLLCTASYECKVVDYLNSHKIRYQWQPKFFNLFIENKEVRYMPDLYLIDSDVFIEIKGYFKQHISKQKWESFHNQFPTSELWDFYKLKSMGIL